MKKIIFFFLILICVLSIPCWASDKSLQFSPNGMVNTSVITCLAGFHKGENRITDSPEQKGEGFWACISFEIPASKLSTFLISVDYDQISFCPENYTLETTQSVLSVTAGLRFFFKGE